MSPYTDLIVRMTDAAVQMLRETGFSPDEIKIARTITELLFPSPSPVHDAEIRTIVASYLEVLDAIESATRVVS